jgi:hypothetical protein
MIVYIDQITPKGFYINRESILDRLYFFDHLDAHITDNFDEYISSKDNFKIAAFYNQFYGNEPVNFVQRNFDLIKNNSNLIFIIQTEFFGTDIVKYCQDNVYCVLPGFYNNIENNTNTIFRGVWFETIVDLYRQLPVNLNNLNNKNKPLFFDALLGRHGLHRDFVNNAIIQHQLTDKILLNYYNKTTNVFENFLMEPECQIYKNSNTGSHSIVHSSIKVRYLNSIVPLSAILPISIYNKTAYSIVAETMYGNHYSFYTEKTIKPILARRLFVMFAGRHYLKNLKSLGFQTFDGIIDESYDNVDDDTQRWTLAVEQIKYLCNQDQTTVLKSIKNIVDHNYKVLTTTNWTDNTIKTMTELIGQNLLNI